MVQGRVQCPGGVEAMHVRNHVIRGYYYIDTMISITPN